MEGVSFSPATREDEMPLRALLDEAGLPSSDFAEHLGNFVVARLGGKVIGAAGLEYPGTKMALLRSVAVTPRFRARGIGRGLTQRAEEMAKEKGAGSVYLLTENAEGYFTAAGYRRIGREDVPPEVQGTKEFSLLCPLTAVAMFKQI